MDPWSKGDYSRHIREASMAMDGPPEGVPPSGKVSWKLLLSAQILKRRRQRYREENGNSRSILGVSFAGTKYRPKGGTEGGHWAARRVPGVPQGPFWSPGGGPPFHS